MLAVLGWLVIVVLALFFTFSAIVLAMFDGGSDSGIEIVGIMAAAAAVWYAVIHFAPFVYVGDT